MECEGNITVFAPNGRTAGRTDRKSSETPSIKEKKNLLSRTQCFFHGFIKFGGNKAPGSPQIPGFTQINNGDLWERPFFNTCFQSDLFKL